MERNDHDEILRLRTRLHELDSTVAGLVMRADAADGWRDRYGPVVDEMSQADRISAGVKSALHERAAAQFTTWQKITAGLVVLASLAGLVLQAVSHL